MPRRSVHCSTSACSAALSSFPRDPSRSSTDSVRFSLTAKSGTIASRARSAGTSGMSSRPASAMSVHSLERCGSRMRPRRRMARMPGDHVRQLLHAVAGESGDAEDLALVDVEVNAVQPATVDVAQLEHDRRVGARGDRRPVVGIDIRADHQLREPPLVDLWNRQRVDNASCAQHRHAVGDLEDLVEAVRDVEDARAAALDLAHHRQQPLHLVVRQHRRRLVEHEHATAAVPALHRAARSRRPSAGPASLPRAVGGCRARRRSGRGSDRSPPPARASAPGRRSRG